MSPQETEHLDSRGMTPHTHKTGSASSPLGRWAGFRMSWMLDTKPQRRGWLVCPAFGIDPVDGPSNLRECRDCNTQQVAVAVGISTALVEAGELWPQCPDCWVKRGRKPLVMHPDIEAELASTGRLERGWQRLAELNAEDE